MHAPTDKAEREALATLSTIKAYVTQKFFAPTGLAKGLGQQPEKIEADVKWLMDHGYIARMDGSSKLYVTYKGWRVGFK